MIESLLLFTAVWCLLRQTKSLVSFTLSHSIKFVTRDATYRVFKRKKKKSCDEQSEHFQFRKQHLHLLYVRKLQNPCNEGSQAECDKNKKWNNVNI